MFFTIFGDATIESKDKADNYLRSYLDAFWIAEYKGTDVVVKCLVTKLLYEKKSQLTLSIACFIYEKLHAYVARKEVDECIWSTV